MVCFVVLTNIGFSGFLDYATRQEWSEHDCDQVDLPFAKLLQPFVVVIVVAIVVVAAAVDVHRLLLELVDVLLLLL